MTSGYRPKGSKGPMYHPERDIAYIGPTLMRTAMGQLLLEKMPESRRMFAEQNGVTQEHINAAVSAFAEAQSDFVSVTESVQSPYEALQRRGFFEHPPVALLLLYAAVGEVLGGAWFQTVRDVTYLNEDSPAGQEIANLLYAARTMADKDPTGEDLPVSAYGSRIIELQRQLENRDAKLAELELELKVAKHKLRDALEEVQSLARDRDARDAVLTRVNNRGLWQILKDWVQGARYLPIIPTPSRGKK
jgi:hypothetical protein